MYVNDIIKFLLLRLRVHPFPRTGSSVSSILTLAVDLIPSYGVRDSRIGAKI